MMYFLAAANKESWAEVVQFFEELTTTYRMDELSPMVDLVREIAQSDRALFFRAGTSMWHLNISTSKQHGMKPREAFISVKLIENNNISITYWYKGHREHEEYIVPDSEVLSQLAPLLRRFWADTREKTP